MSEAAGSLHDVALPMVRESFGWALWLHVVFDALPSSGSQWS